MQLAPHAHAVFKLRIIVVIIRRRNGPPGQQEPLVAGIDNAHAMLRLIFFAVLLQNIKHAGRRLLVIGCQRVQSLAKTCQAAGHRGDAAHRRVERRELFDAFAQVLAVVDAPTQHELAVHLDALGGEFVDIVQRLARVFVCHHPDAQLRLDRVHRDVDGRDVHALDALDLVRVQIRQCDIVAE